MNDEKINYVIEMIKDMDLENKLRLAICMCDNYSHTNLEYDKKEMYKYFDNLLKGINIEYRTTTVNFATILIQFLFHLKLWKWIQHSKIESLYIFLIV